MLLLKTVDGEANLLITWQRILKLNFLYIKGFSVRNLKYMRKFAELYTDFEFVQTVSAQIL